MGGVDLIDHMKTIYHYDARWKLKFHLREFFLLQVVFTMSSWHYTCTYGRPYFYPNIFQVFWNISLNCF